MYFIIQSTVSNRSLSFDFGYLAFSNQYLIVLFGVKDDMLQKTWDQLNKCSPSQLKQQIQKIIIIQRNGHAQLYVLQGLQSSPHFSLSSQGTKDIIALCQEKQIRYELFLNKSHLNWANMSCSTLNTENDVFVKNSSHLYACGVEKRYIDLMNQVFVLVCPSLVRSSHRNLQQRSKYVINLGITDQKIDKQERISMTGRVGLSLISSISNIQKLTQDSLKVIGELLLYVTTQVLPKTTFNNIFHTNNKYELHYIREFGKQLCINNDLDLDRFFVPSISLLINQELNPHCDSMNPVEKYNDHTVALSCQIPMSKVPIEFSKQFKEEFKYEIPFCLVMYKRKALIYYARRMEALNKYMNSSVLESSGRKKIVNLITSVGSERDYIGRCFSNDGWKQTSTNFVYDHSLYNKMKLTTYDEAVDKMVSNLYSFYLYILLSYYQLNVQSHY